MVFRLAIATALGMTLVLSSPAAACDNEHFFPLTDATLEPLSVPAREIGTWLSASPHSSGIRFASSLHGHDLWLDILEFPEDAPEVGSLRALMQLGRVAGGGFDRLLLVDGQEVLFMVSETDLRAAGCQFVWPSNTGADPLMLMRTLIGAIRDEETGIPIQAVSATGSVATTIQAMAVVHDSLNPAWVSSARPANKKQNAPKNQREKMVETVAPRVQAKAEGVLVLSGL